MLKHDTRSDIFTILELEVNIYPPHQICKGGLVRTAKQDGSYVPNVTSSHSELVSESQIAILALV